MYFLSVLFHNSRRERAPIYNHNLATCRAFKFVRDLMMPNLDFNCTSAQRMPWALDLCPAIVKTASAIVDWGGWACPPGVVEREGGSLFFQADDSSLWCRMSSVWNAVGLSSPVYAWTVFEVVPALLLLDWSGQLFFHTATSALASVVICLPCIYPVHAIACAWNKWINEMADLLLPGATVLLIACGSEFVGQVLHWSLTK